MERLEFPEDFVWGAATASYQVEGAVNEDGRSESIWDVFARVPGAVYGGESGAVACDHYHRYQEDAALMAALGFKRYRFSIAWPRILPEGTGRVNLKGLAFYRNLCAELHKHGISACATLYQWDLPQVLQDKGGWTERRTAEAFAEYAEACFRGLGGLVDQWITINEPYCIAYLGHDTGRHAPGIRDLNKALRVVHHINLAHGLAVQVYRKTGLDAPIGITWNPSTPRPATGNPADKKAALTARAVETEVFTNPVLGKGYPGIVTQELGLPLPVQNDDLEIIAQKIDFIGVNYYMEHPVAADKNARFGYAQRPFWQERSDLGWPIVPGGLERQLRWIHSIAGGLPLYVTENGCARHDRIEPDNRIHDKERIEYFRRHLAVCSRLIQEGINIKGYYVWSLLDNFEWSYGYAERFGIVYVDYADQKRIPKDSAYFFRDLIAGYGE